MKSYRVGISLIALALVGQTSHAFAKTTQAKPQLPAALASKKLYVKNTPASELVRRINEIWKQDSKTTKDAVELIPKDAYRSIIVRTTPEAFVELQEICKALDVKPRGARIGLRLIKIERTRLGIDKETLYESSFVNVVNSTQKEVTFRSGGSETKILLVPRINGDNSISLGVVFDISRDSDIGRYGSMSTTYCRLYQPNDWVTVGALGLAREEQSSFPLPMYRLEATIADAK